MSSKRFRLLAVILTSIFALLAESAFATHFRYGYISWERDLTYTNPSNPNEVKIRVTVEGGGRWTYTSWTQATAPTGFVPATRCTTSAAVCCAGVPSIPGDATALSCPNVGSLFQFVGGTVGSGVYFDAPQSGQYVKVVGKHGITLVAAQQATYANLPQTPYNITTNPSSASVLQVDSIATNVVPTEDTVYGRFVFDILMDKTKVLNLTWANTNRLSTLLDSNNDRPWQIKATIDLTGTNADVVTKSPKSQVPAVISVFTGRVNQVQLPAATFDNLIPRWSISSSTDSQLLNPTPVITGGASWNLDPNTGVVSFQPRAIGLYAVQFRLAGVDPSTGVERVNVPIDVMFQALSPSSTAVALSAPQTDYTTSVNSPFSYTVTSTMTQGVPGYRININSTTLPAGAFFTGPGQCTAAGATSTCTLTFNWTPSVNSSASNVCYTSTVFNGPTLVTSAPSFCVNVDLNPLGTTLTTAAASGVAGGGPISLSATLKRTIDSVPLPGRVVKFTFDQDPNNPPWVSTPAGSNGVDTAVTDTNGVATLTVPIVRTLPAGSTYTATFNAIAGELLQSSFTSGAISIKAATTSMNVPTLALTPTIGYPVNTSALLNRVYTDGGTLAIGADVQFTLSGSGAPTTNLVATTGANGVASVTFDPAVLPTVGPYTVQASFSGNANLFPNADGSPATATTAPFTLRQRTQLTLPAVAATVGVQTTLTATLVSLPANAPLAGRSVTISAASMTPSTLTVTTNAAGVATFPVTFGSTGNVVVTASYTPSSTETNRNALLAAETDAATVVVSLAATQLAFVSPQTAVTVNQPFSMTAQLTRTNTTGSVNGVSVTFQLKNGATVVQTRTATTDTLGNATASFTAIPTVGVYTVQATSPATTQLNGAASSVLPITVVNQQVAVLAVSPVSTFSGSNTSFSATLTANGTPVVGEIVSFSAPTFGALGSATTNSSGVATVTAVAGAPSTGTYTAAYAGSGVYAAASANSTFTVSAVATQLSLGTVPSTTTLGAAALSISATLTRTTPPAGAISGASVTFTVTAPNGTTSSPTAVTAANGTATINLTPSMRGIYTIAASYAGTPSITASSTAAASVSVYQPAVLSLVAPTGVAGNTVQIVATLRNSITNVGIPGQVVTFTFNGTNVTASTDANGQATITTVFPNAGSQQVDASFQNAADFFADHNGQPIAETASTVGTIAAAQTSLAGVTVPATANVGSTLTASTTLTRISAPAGVVAGQPVSFVLTAPGGGVTSLSAFTDGGGFAAVTFPALTARGSYSLVATFAGTGGLAASSTAAATVTVSQNLQVTLAAPASVIAGAPVQFTATVNALPANTPVTDPLTVTFTAGSLSASATVVNGTATASITFPNASLQTATASIGAGNGYLAATSNTASFTVDPAFAAFAPLNLNSTAFVGDTLAISTTLTRTSAPTFAIPGATVSFSVNGDAGNPGGATQQTFTATTDSSGVAQISVPLNARGAYHVTASYAGSASTVPTSRSADFSVFQKTAVIVNVAHGVATDSTLLSAGVVTVPNNAPLAGQTLNFDFSGVTPQGSAVTNGSGIATLSRAFALPGSYPVTVSFENLAGFFVDVNGDALPTTAASTVTIDAVATALGTITLPASSLVGDDLTVTTTLTRVTAPAGALANRQITFTMNGATPQTATTDSNGSAAVTFHISARGSYIVSASYAGSGAELPSSTSTTGSARQQTQIAVAQAGVGTAGVPAEVTATLIATPGGALGGQLISFSMPGGVPSSASATTDPNGTARATVTFSSGGSFPVTATFAADQGDFTNHNGQVAPETASVTAVVNRATAQLSSVSAPSHSLVGDAVTLVTTLSRVTAPSGPWAGSVTFTITQPDGSTQSIPATAGSNGVASASFTPSMRGVFSVTASFAGDSSLNSATSSAASVTVYQRTALTVAPATVASHAPVTISATLTQVPSAALLSGQTVAFTFSDGSWATATTNASGVASVTQSFATVGDVTVTATFSNAAGFYADSTGAFPIIETTGTGTVHVTNNAPTFTAPSNITAEATGANGAVASFTANGSDIEDGSIAAVCAPASGSTFPIGSTTVSCTVTDSLNAQVSGTFSVTVQDTTAPALTLPTVAPASATSAAGRQVFYTATATDIVDAAPTVVCAPVSGSTFAIGSTTVNCTATDAHNNSSTGAFSVSVTNNAPTFSAPANITLPATSPNGRAVTFSALGSDIEDGSLTADCQAQSGNTFPLGTTNISCTVTDVAGATASGSFSITITNTAPTIVDLPNVTASATSAAGRAVSFTSTGNDAEDGALTPVCNATSGATFPLGTTNVTCTVTDVAGFTASDSFTITITNNAPTFTAPANISLTATSSAGRAVTFSALGSDIEDGSLTADCQTQSGNTFPLGTTNIACTVTDVAGATASGSFSITITNTAPTIVDLPNLSGEATAASGRAFTFTSTGDDAEQGAITPVCTASSGTFPIGTTTVSCTVTDVAGFTASDSFTITVVDTTAPVLTLPTIAPAFATSAAGRVVTYSASALDIVDGSTAVTCAPLSGSTFPIATTTVNCSTSDSRGNTRTGSFAVSITNTAPTIVDLPNLSGEATGAAGRAFSFTSTGNDAEDGAKTPVCSASSGTFPIGTTTVTCTVTDVAGFTASDSFTITVVDTTAPTVTVSGITVQQTSPAGAVGVYAFSATDIVDGALTPTCTPASGTTFARGATTVTCTRTDAHGNTGTATATVTVVDTIKPVVTYTGNAGTYAADQTINITCTATDSGSGVASTTCANVTGPAYSFAVGVNTRSASATDVAGNTNSASISFTVTVPPAALGNVITQLVDSPSVAATLNHTLNLATGAPNANARASHLDKMIKDINKEIGKTLTAAEAATLINLINQLY